MPSVRAKPYRPPRLTPEMIGKVGTFVRAGATYEKAMESQGVPADLANRWLELGNLGRRLYRALSSEVFMARASARVVAETRTFETQPGFWLRYSPEQRIKANEPAWKSIDAALSVSVNPETGTVNVTQFVGDGLRILEKAGRPFDPLRELPAPSAASTNGHAPGATLAFRACARCERPTSHEKAVYCGDTCRKAAYKERKREKDRNGTQEEKP